MKWLLRYHLYYSEFLTLQSTNEKFVLEDAQCFNSISEPSSEIRKTSFILFWHCNRPTKNSLYPCIELSSQRGLVSFMSIGLYWNKNSQTTTANICNFKIELQLLPRYWYQSICLNFNHYCYSLYHWPLFYCI